MSNNPIARDPASRLTNLAKSITGWVIEKVDRRHLNEAIFKAVTDWTWGTQGQTTTDEVDFYTDASGIPRNKAGDNITASILDDDKILIAHDVTQTANLLLDAGGKKITLKMLQGVTLDMDTFDLTLGGTGDSIGGDIRVIGTGVGTLTIEKSNGLRVNHATMIIILVNSSDIIINNETGNGVEFETSSDLVCDAISVNQARASFSRMSLINKTDFTPKYLNNKILTWTMPGDLESGQIEQAATDYGCWVDSDENLRLVADIESVTDGVTAGFLDDSANTAATQLWKAGDIVYNLDDKTKTTIKTTPTVDGNDVELNADIFTASPKGYKIVKQSPEGLGENRERLFTVRNNSGSDFDDSWYTQIQEPKEYNGDGSDFDVTSGAGGFAIVKAQAVLHQVNDWFTEKGTWLYDFNYSWTSSSSGRTNYAVNSSGVLFEATTNNFQPISHYVAGAGTTFFSKAYASPNTDTTTSVFDTVTATGGSHSGENMVLEVKPPWGK